MSSQQREFLRIEAASLREDILHLQSRINFIDEASDPLWVTKQLSDIKRKIDALEAYAESIVNTHATASDRRLQLETELNRKHLRIGRISSLLISDRRESSPKVYGVGNIAKRSARRVGELSEEKATELCSNLEISLDDLKALIKKGK